MYIYIRIIHIGANQSSVTQRQGNLFSILDLSERIRSTILLIKDYREISLELVLQVKLSGLVHARLEIAYSRFTHVTHFIWPFTDKFGKVIFLDPLVYLLDFLLVTI